MSTIGELLDTLAVQLAGEDVPPARADARDLIAAVLDQPRFWPSAHRDDAIDDVVQNRVEIAAHRWREGMPFQYAVGKASFRHLTLSVDPRVLIPRPETELLVDLVLLTAGSNGEVADVGTGSGAIALSLAAEGNFSRIIATDVSADALAVARANLRSLPEERRAVVEFVEGDLLAPLRGLQLRALASNPPYISTAEKGDLPTAVRDWEPHLALFSADNGMRAIRDILRGAPEVLEPGGVLVMELDAGRASATVAEATTDARWRSVELRHDLTGRERFLVARRQER